MRLPDAVCAQASGAKHAGIDEQGAGKLYLGGAGSGPHDNTDLVLRSKFTSAHSSFLKFLRALEREMKGCNSFRVFLTLFFSLFLFLLKKLGICV